MEASEAKLPLHEDIMQLARLGEIGPIQKLFDEGKYKATHTDSENITPLHVRRIHTLFIILSLAGVLRITTVGCYQ